MILWAAALLRSLAASGAAGGRAVDGRGRDVPVGLAFLSIYTRPHTVVTASEWVYRHIPAGKKILTQHWDEGFPLPLPGAAIPTKYKVIDLPYYEPDTPEKWRQHQPASSPAPTTSPSRPSGSTAR